MNKELNEKLICSCRHEVRYDSLTGKLYHYRKEHPNISYIKEDRDIYTIKCVKCEREGRQKCRKPVIFNLNE